MNYSINELADMFGGEKVYIPARPGEARNTLADNSDLKKHTGWKPDTLVTEYVQNFVNSVQKEPKHDIISLWNRFKKVFHNLSF
jgi:UDP-glucose 4-epimerase